MDDRKNLTSLMTGTLNKHSSLINYHILKGDFISTNAQKVIWQIFYKEQEDLKVKFSEVFKKYILQIFHHKSESELKELFFNMYSMKKINYSKLEINKKNLLEILDEITKNKFLEILKLSNGDNKSKLLLDFKELYSTKIIMNRDKDFEQKLLKEISFINLKPKKQKGNLPLPINNNFLPEQISIIINELKEYCKKIAIDEISKEKYLNLTRMNKILKSNIVRLKKEIKEASETQLELNYINHRKLDIDIKANFISSVTFEKEENQKQIWLKYEIPRSISELLLNPEVYVPIDGCVIESLTSINAIMLYEFLKDNIKSGAVVLTKEHFFNFIKCIEKCKKNRFELENRVLIPAIAQINSMTDIYVKYEFNPAPSYWKNIIFFIEKNKKNTRTLEEFIQEDFQEVMKDLFMEEPIEEKVNYRKNEEVLKAVTYAKRNIYVSRAWKSDGDRKVNQILKTYGQKYTVMILRELYESLNQNINITITSYINGMIKNKRKEAKDIEKKEVKKLKVEKNLKKSEAKEELTIDPIQEDLKLTNEFDNNYLDELIEKIEKIKNNKNISKQFNITTEEFSKLLMRYRELGKKAPIVFLREKIKQN